MLGEGLWVEKEKVASGCPFLQNSQEPWVAQKYVMGVRGRRGVGKVCKEHLPIGFLYLPFSV